MDIDRVRRALPGREIYWHETIDSTMLAAQSLARAGCPHGTAVVADFQSAGVGRYGRHWHSPRGAGLYVTVVLRPSRRLDALPILTLAVGLAARQAIAETCALECDLRWPNDVLANGRKCAGILLQLDGAAVLAGVGVNVNHTEFPADIAATATSLRLVTGRAHRRDDLLASLLAGIDHFTSLDDDAILARFADASSYVHGRRVRVDQGDRVVTGVTDGLDASGFLILRDDDGRTSLIMAGGVRPA
jgi:BirA family biotin operon repressor/biotin-[acetyl-CoA-carboxylase] ligase